MAKNAILLYRGNNPLLKVIGNILKNDLKIESIDSEQYTKMDYEKCNGFITDLSNNYGLVLTDDSMYKRGSNVVSLYNLIKDLTHEDWSEQVKQVADHIKKSGKDPVLLPVAISDHMTHYWKCDEDDNDINELETKLNPEKAEKIKQDYGDENGFLGNRYSLSQSKRYKKDIYICQLLGEITGIKVLPFSKDLDNPSFMISSYRDKMDSVGTITEALKEIDVGSSKAVILGDHHLRYFTKEGVEKTELNKVKFYPICQCCLSLNPEVRIGYTKEMLNLGIDVLEHKPGQRDYSLLVNKVKNLITKMHNNNNNNKKHQE